MSDKTVYVQGGTGGVSIVGLLGLTFIVLKLIGVIAWSWVWVLAPFWIPLALTLAVLVIIGIILLITYGIDRR